MVAAAPLSQTPLLVELLRVSKDYDAGGGLVRAMRDVNLTIAQGEFVAIVGTSGSGKSTMMNILGCLDRPTRGTYLLAGIDVGDRQGDSRAIVRNRVIGFIFQGFNLLARTTALENVELPLQYRGVRARERRRRAVAALEAVGLGTRMDHKPNQLSGGQQQRVAIARALVTDPPLLLADEPTGNLDSHTSLEVLALLQKLNRERGITVVLVTHERDIAACASRVITMRDGFVVSDVAQAAPLDAFAELAHLPVAADGMVSVSPGVDEGDAAAVRIGGPVPLSAYAMMWVGDLLGEVLVAAYLGVVLHLSVLKFFWVGRAFGELGKGWVGARWLRRSLGRASTSDQRVRMALWYTMVVTCGGLAVGLAVAARFPLQHVPGADELSNIATRASSRGWAVLVSVVGAAVGCLVLLRYLLLTLFNPRR